MKQNKIPISTILPSLALLLVGALCQNSQAATYEVAPTGNDINAGSAAAPWKTLQKAALTVQAGDTVLINNGNYAGFRIRTSGTAASRITFKAKTKWGAKVTSVNPYGDADWITVLSASYVTIDGLEVSGSTRAGIGVRSMEDETGNDTRNNIVQNCYCHDNGLPSGGAHDGIFTGFALNFTAQDNVCDHNGEHGIYISNSADNPIVRRNRCSNNRNCGIQLNADYNTQINGNADGLISNWLIENNVIYGNGVAGGAAINLDGDINGICRNNLIYNNLASGIALYSIDGAQASHHNLIVNNTVYNPNSNRGALVFLDNANNNTVFNNIFISGDGMDIGAVTGFTHDYNVVSSYEGGVAAAAHEKDASAASLFVAAGSDFHLAPNSPALNAGIATLNGASAPTVDIDNAPRPSGSGFDLGCYEAGAVAQPGTLRFSAANFNVNEGAGTVTISVQRVGGSDGAVGAHYATTSGGTATVTTDYAATSGQISFAAGDTTAKTFTVSIVNDALVEPQETIKLALSAPTGGATLDATLKNATISIVDNDQGDTIAPTAAFVSPLNNSFVANLNSISGTAADEAGGSGLQRVTLQIRRLSDGLYWSGTAWGAPATELTTTLNNGNWSRNTGNPAGAALPTVQYALRAYAYDVAGNRGAVIVLTTVDKAPPKVTLDTPAANANLHQLPVIAGTTSDDVAVTRVALTIQRIGDGLYWSGTKWGTTPTSLEATINGNTWTRSSGNPPEFYVNSNKVPPDPYRIFVGARDNAGKSVGVTHDFTLGGTSVAPLQGPSGNLARLPQERSNA